MTKDELDEQFFHHDAVVPSITVFSYEPAPPEDMGFFAPGNKELESRDGRKEEVGEGNRGEYRYSTGEGGRRQERRSKKKTSSPMDVYRQSLGEWSRGD